MINYIVGYFSYIKLWLVSFLQLNDYYTYCKLGLIQNNTEKEIKIKHLRFSKTPNAHNYPGRFGKSARTSLDKKEDNVRGKEATLDICSSQLCMKL